MDLRESNIDKLAQTVFDTLIIGGGINGAVAAAALSGKGASVALIDQRDFAGFTSQQSSNLAWGGIKYMESNDFPLVWDLCKSRNHLIENYPSRVQEIRFYSTLSRGFRHHPRFVWAGTWLYWLFGRFATQAPRWLSKATVNAEEPLIRTENYYGGFEYSDAYLRDNDARFVFQFILAAMDRGCTAANYVESLGSHREDDLWITQMRDTRSGRTWQVRSKVLINATGPFVDENNIRTGEKTAHRHVFSKGIHLIVPQITANHRVLTFFADDGRLFFAIPMDQHTCVGTTDTRSDSPFSEVTEEDRQFVLENINKRLNLKKPLTRDDIIAERCGIRPLVVNATGNGSQERDFLQLSRKHADDVNRDTRHISIFGGKLTDCVNVGNEIAGYVSDMGVALPDPGFKWYGEPPRTVYEKFMQAAQAMNLDALPAASADTGTGEKLSQRLWRRYDQQAFELLEAIERDPRQAEILIEGTDFIRGELHLMRQREMITCLDDFLRRRSKIALVVRRDDIRCAKGIMEACEILFGDQAKARYDEYFDAPFATAHSDETRSAITNSQEASNDTMIRRA